MATGDLPHVLVVGEDETVTSSMCELLAHAPVRCTGATGSLQAFAVSREAGVDIALLDVSGMSAEEGLDLARRLRDEVEDLGVVLVATSRSLESLIEALRVGVVDFLSRPFARGELADAVGRAVEWRSAVRMSRGALGRYEQEMALGAAKFARVFAESGIASSGALDVYLQQLYGRHVGALEHTRRVASASVLIAANMAIVEPALGDLERAALLHDVGKLVIPKAVLRKSWPLSAAEHALVRSHVRAAADAVSGIPFLAPTADILIATRERFDGSGYPYGLKGAAIPLGARIIAVAEAFDSLSAGREVSDDAAAHAANVELVRGAGSLFDPDVVNVWLRCLDRFEPLMPASIQS